MTSDCSEPIRVLAIDPTTRGFGFVVLEGSQTLVDWGVKTARQNKNAKCLAQVKELVRFYQPDVIVVEDFARKESRRCQRVQKLLADIAKLAAGLKVTAERCSPDQVRRALSVSATATKHEVAMAVAARLPELARLVPPRRRAWMSEDHRSAIFDAAGLGFCLFRLCLGEFHFWRSVRPSADDTIF